MLWSGARARSRRVEVLEFRNTDNFNIRFMAKAAAAWDKAAARIRARRDDWETEVPPGRLGAKADADG